MADCCVRIIEQTCLTGGGPYTVLYDTPGPGQITVVDNGSGNSYVLNVNSTIDFSNLTYNQITALCDTIADNCAVATEITIINNDTLQMLDGQGNVISTVDLSTLVVCGGPYSVAANTPIVGQITVTDDSCGATFVLDIAGSIDFSTLTIPQIAELCTVISDNCDLTGTVVISNFDTTQITELCDLLNVNCNLTETIVMSDLTTVQITELCAELNANCNLTETIVVSDLDPTQITELCALLVDNCNLTETIVVSDFDQIQITELCTVITDNCALATTLTLEGDLLILRDGGGDILSVVDTDLLAGGGSTSIMTDNGDGTYTHDDGNGNTTLITGGSVLTGTGAPVLPPPGDTLIYVDESTGDLYTWDGTNWGLVGGGVTGNTSVLTDNGDGTYTHDDGTGNLTVIDIPFNETLTTFTDNGNGTYTYVSENGTSTTTAVPGAETVTTLINNGDGTFTYTSENGTITVIDIPFNETSTAITNLVAGHLIGTYTNEDGVTYNIDETITPITDNGNGTYTYFDEAGTLTVIDIPGSETTTLMTNLNTGNAIATYVDEDGNLYTISETITSMSDNGNGSFSYTSESGLTTTINICFALSSCSVSSLSDVNAAGVAVGEILVWDGANFVPGTAGTGAGTNWFTDDQTQTANRSHDAAGFSTEVLDQSNFYMTTTSDDYFSMGGTSTFLVSARGLESTELNLRSSQGRIRSYDTAGQMKSELFAGSQIRLTDADGEYFIGSSTAASQPPLDNSQGTVLAYDSTTGQIYQKDDCCGGAAQSMVDDSGVNINTVAVDPTSAYLHSSGGGDFSKFEALPEYVEFGAVLTATTNPTAVPVGNTVFMFVRNGELLVKDTFGNVMQLSSHANEKWEFLSELYHELDELQNVTHHTNGDVVQIEYSFLNVSWALIGNTKTGKYKVYDNDSKVLLKGADKSLVS